MTQLTTTRRNPDPFAALVNGFLTRNAPWGMEAFEREGDWLPAADVSSDADGYTFRFDLPGIPKDAIDVNLEDGVLTVSGERKSENEGSDAANVHRRERYYGHFTRSFKLPADADTESVEAKYDNGVLQLRVGKHEAAKPRKIAVS